ncbi:MAG: hypothetical protein IBJ15_11165 [Alphaproteobacteria bacterium]|nr:hypothetical protein [Alphaproteobacteria bacterium]
MLDIARTLAHRHFAAREIVEPGGLDGRSRAGHENLVHAGQPRPREIDDFLALRGDREIGGDRIAPPVQQRREHLVARRGHEHDADRQALFGAALVEPGFEFAAELGRHAHLAALVDEEMGLAIGHDQPERALRQNRVEIAGAHADRGKCNRFGLGRDRCRCGKRRQQQNRGGEALHCAAAPAFAA